MTIKLDRMPTEVKKRVTEVSGLLLNAYEGDRGAKMKLVDEAFTSGDFPAIFQLINNAIIQSAFTLAAPGLWTQISKRVLRDSLKPGVYKSFDVDLSNLPADAAGFKTLPGGLPHIPELGPYPAIGFSASSGSIAVSKFGARIQFSWESWQTDDYQVISSLPDAMVTLAKRTEDLQTFSVILDTAGWNATTFTPTTDPAILKANTALATTLNSPLTLNSLQAAIIQASQVDPSYDPTKLRVNTIDKWVLVCSRALVPLANTLLAATQVRTTDSNGNVLIGTNPIGDKISVLGVPYIDTLSASSSYKNTMWGLFPIEGNGADRATLVTTFLRGQETPELRIKNDAGNALSGGSLDAYAGSFDADDIQIRLRYFTDAYLIDKVGIVISKGTGVA